MVENNQTGKATGIRTTPGPKDQIRKIGFSNPRLMAAGIDVISLQELRERAPSTLRAPQRVEFYFLMLIQEGQCRHTVDFVDHALLPGSVVFLRPGQVQQWHMNENVQGLVVLMSEEVMTPSLGQPDAAFKLMALDLWPSASILSMGLFLTAFADAQRVKAEIGSFKSSEREAIIIRYQTMTLLLRLADELRIGDIGHAKKREAEIYRMFTRELETGFYKHLTVADYAKRLGYSTSTLQRACLSSARTAAKSVIDNRLVLEAKRMLVHTDGASTHVGYRLGFREPSNFVKFFKRMTGVTPQSYRLAKTSGHDSAERPE